MSAVQKVRSPIDLDGGTRENVGPPPLPSKGRERGKIPRRRTRHRKGANNFELGEHACKKIEIEEIEGSTCMGRTYSG